MLTVIKHFVSGRTTLFLSIMATDADENRAQNQIQIVIQNSGLGGLERRVNYREIFPEKRMTGVNAAQISVAIATILNEIIMLSLRHGMQIYSWRFEQIDISFGIWTGAVFIASGIVGIFAAKRPSKCSIIASIITTVIGEVFCFILVVANGFGLAKSARYLDDNYRNYGVIAGLFLVQLVFALTQSVLGIIASVICCRSVCFGCCGDDFGEAGVFTPEAKLVYTPKPAENAENASGSSGSVENEDTLIAM